MKTKLTCLLCFSILFFSCKQENVEKSNNETQNIKKSTSKCLDNSGIDLRLGDENLMLAFNAKDQRFQPLHLDIVGDIAILGRMLQSNEKDKVTFRLKEIVGCEKFSLLKATYLKFKDDTNPCVIGNNRMHHISLNIEENTNGNRNTEIDLDTLINFKNGDIIDIHIDSKNSIIQSKKIPNNCASSPTPLFGSGVCKSIVKK